MRSWADTQGDVAKGIRGPHWNGWQPLNDAYSSSMLCSRDTHPKLLHSDPSTGSHFCHHLRSGIQISMIQLLLQHRPELPGVSRLCQALDFGAIFIAACSG